MELCMYNMWRFFKVAYVSQAMQVNVADPLLGEWHYHLYIRMYS